MERLYLALLPLTAVLLVIGRLTMGGGLLRPWFRTIAELSLELVRCGKHVVE